MPVQAVLSPWRSVSLALCKGVIGLFQKPSEKHRYRRDRLEGALSFDAWLTTSHDQRNGSAQPSVTNLNVHLFFRGPNLQTTVPNNFPIPAVRAIANAPQNVTRAVARRTFAPPALAPIAPRRARKPKDAADTMGTSALAGDTTTMSKGMAAPTENVAADVSAACTGRAVVISEIPSSSRAWAVKASFAISCWATCRASA